MDTELIGNALVPVAIAVAGFMIVVLGSFSTAIRRLDREVKRSGEQRDQLISENAGLRETLRTVEDERHVMKREIDAIREERTQYKIELEAVRKQSDSLLARVDKYEEVILNLRTEIQNRDREYQRKIDAEGIARQKAEASAFKLEKERDLLSVQKDALTQRLQDQDTLHAAEIVALKLQIDKLEAESRQLSASTEQLREQVQALNTERAALEHRVHELENKGVDPDA